MGKVKTTRSGHIEPCLSIYLTDAGFQLLFVGTGSAKYRIVEKSFFAPIWGKSQGLLFSKGLANGIRQGDAEYAGWRRGGFSTSARKAEISTPFGEENSPSLRVRKILTVIMKFVLPCPMATFGLCEYDTGGIYSQRWGLLTLVGKNRGGRIYAPSNPAQHFV